MNQIYSVNYKRTHLPSGSIQTFDFSGTHSLVFGELSDGYSFSRKVEVAKDLIDSWNRMHRDTWHYEVVIFGDKDRLHRLEQLRQALSDEQAKLREVQKNINALNAEIGGLT